MDRELKVQVLYTMVQGWIGLGWEYDISRKVFVRPRGVKRQAERRCWQMDEGRLAQVRKL